MIVLMHEVEILYVKTRALASVVNFTKVHWA